MTLETAQLLCTALWKHDNELETLYRPTHKNHPCTIWSNQSDANFNWTVEHGIALAEEYTHRYGKRHKSQDVIEWCGEYGLNKPGNLTPFALAMPDDYKEENAVGAYRKYYILDKLKNIDCRWTKRNPPEWIRGQHRMSKWKIITYRQKLFKIESKINKTPRWNIIYHLWLAWRRSSLKARIFQRKN